MKGIIVNRGSFTETTKGTHLAAFFESAAFSL